MKTRPYFRFYFIVTSIFLGILLLSCNKKSKSETETIVGNYKMPETIPLTFTEPEPFEWETITSDSLTKPEIFSLNVDALPSKPFALNGFEPLKSPMKEYPLDWDNLPTEPVKFDSVPFTITKSTIKKPTVTKMKPLGIMEGTYANLLQLSTSEGLPGNNITSFLETSDGAVWIGANKSSLTFYDGENSLIYDYPAAVKMTLDQKGKLWLANPDSRAITILDFKKNIEYTITLGSSFIPLDIFCDSKGALYIASIQDGLYKIDAEMKKLQKLANQGINAAWRLFEDSKQNLWLSAPPVGLVVLDTERAILKKFSKTTIDEPFQFVGDMIEDKVGSIWLTLPDITTNIPRALRLSFVENTINVLECKNDYNITAENIVEDTQGNIWLIGDKEAFILNKNGNAYQTIKHGGELNTKGNLPRSIMRKDGSIWIATIDKGIIIANEFTLTTEYLDVSKGLLDDRVWEIEEDSRGEIWLGTPSGINIIDPRENTIKSLSHELLHSTNKNSSVNKIQEISKDIYFIDAAGGFSILDRQKNKLTKYAGSSKPTFKVWDIELMNEHSILMTTRAGFFKYDIYNSTLKKITSKTNPNIFKAVKQSIMSLDDKETLWLPTQKGLAKIDLNTDTVRYLTEEQGLCSNNVNVIKYSKEGALWVATLDGLAILNPENNTLTNLKQENGLIPDEIYDLIERENDLYAASVNGLIHIEKSTAEARSDRFYNFNAGLGFKSNDYLENSPRFLKNGQFWAGVTNPSNQFKVLVIDGAPKPDTTASNIHITNIYVMDETPGFIANNTIDPLTTKSSSYASTNAIKWDSVTFPYVLPHGLELPYDQNSVSFNYGSTDVYNRDKLTYRFILDGEDEDWTFASSATKTKNYYNLKPGRYNFKVSARGFNNKWSVPATFPFRIHPPWWHTWWAYVLFGIIAVGLLRAYVLFRAKKLKKENRILEERVALRTEQLNSKIDQLKETQSQLIQSEKMASLGELTAGIAHEIQNPLNFVNNFSEVNSELIAEMKQELEKGNFKEVNSLANDIDENEKKIIFHGKRADAIVKGMLQHSRSSSGQKEPTDISALADEYLRLAYHGLRAKDKGFNAIMNTDFDPKIGTVDVVPQDMGRVILNLITNAFYVVKQKKEQQKEDYEPTVSVRTKRNKDTIAISVKDNGNGIPKAIKEKIFQPFFTTKPSGEGTGLGLSLSYDIVKSHGGELKVETQEGEGTEFTILLPIVQTKNT